MKLNKTILLGLLILFVSQKSISQGWLKSLPIHGNKISQSSDGNFLVSSHGILTDRGSDLMKIDQNGDTLWVQIHDADFNCSTHLELDDGSILMAGRRSLSPQSYFHYSPYLLKVDSLGQEIWSNVFSNNSDTTSDYFIDMIRAQDGNILLLRGNRILAGNNAISTSVLPTIIKIDTIGNIIWENEFPDLIGVASPFIKHPDGGMVVHIGLRFNEGHALLHVDEEGNELNRTIFDLNLFSPPSEWVSRIVKTKDDNYLLGGVTETISDTTFTTFFTLHKIDFEGNELWSKTYPELISPRLDAIKALEDGGFIIFGREFHTLANSANQFLTFQAFAMKIDKDGEMEWKRNYGNFSTHYQVNSVIQSSPNEIIATGQTFEVDPATETGFTGENGFVLKLDSLGFLYRNFIQGNVFEDINQDCSSNSDFGLDRWYVELVGDGSFFQVTDSLGNYLFQADTGSYDIKVHPLSPYWSPCDTVQSVDLNLYDTLNVNFPIRAQVDCPYLVVDISTPLLRRCFDNTYNINYCNLGTIPEEDAYVEIELDTFLIFNSSSIPLTNQEGNNYRFDLGQLEVSECGQFNINVTVDCDSTPLGLTHCVQANIYPDSLCFPAPGWSGASIEVDAECIGDSIVFTITNIGTAPSTPNLEYLVIEDEVILIQDEFTLNPAEGLTFTVPAIGAVYYLEAEQEPNHPGDNNPSITIEGCGLGEPSYFGLYNQFSQNDGDPFVSIDCQENVGAWDPNDKRAFPKGYNDDHLLEANTDIEYHIRFQNTGTDTAFNIVVRDALSENLVLTSVRPGASSHPYEFSIRPDRTLEFTFNNIMLPDSNVNEVASHGYIKFKVSQVPDLEDGETIYNGAAIYFDFNLPIITNQTSHTIGRNFILTKVIEHKHSANPAKVFPNPFKEQVTFEMAEINATQKLQFYLMDLQGRVIRKEQFQGNIFEFNRNGLPRGIYFYRIEMEGRTINSGKVITQ